MGKIQKEFQLSDDTVLPYQIQGSGDPIIFIHGLFGKSQDFKEVIEIVSKNFCCITYDHRGHGKSKAETGLNLKQFAEDLREFIEYLSLQDVILVGYSMGSFTIFNYVQQFGCEYVKKIVLVDITPKMINDDTWSNGVYRGEYRKPELENDLLTMTKDFMKFASYFTYRNMTKYSGKPYRTKASFLSKILAKLLIGNSPKKKKLTYDLWKNIATLDHRETLKNFQVPTAVFYADPGSLFTPDVAVYMQSQIPNVTLFPFMEATHALLFSHGKQFGRELLVFAKE